MTGETFIATYHISCPIDQAEARAQDICVEQTVEFPPDLIEREDIHEEIIGKVLSVVKRGDDLFEADIEFATETAGRELPQLLNVLFGNISIKPGIKLVGFDLAESQYEVFKGPRFGRKGIRELLGVPDRPLVATAVKPMGLSAGELANLASKFATGEIDMIKDDHGLSDQTFCRFEDRVKQCADAVNAAVAKTGKPCLYFPNITAPIDQIRDRAHFAKEAGAGGCVISPGLVGMDTMRSIAEDDDLAMPILAHPSLLGSFTVNPTFGISHGALYGQITRLAGADATIFPSAGGRFAFTEAECKDLADRTLLPMGHLKPTLPVPAGGMTFDKIPKMLDLYGKEVILLIGGDLHRHGPDLSENCRKFVELVS